MGKKSKSKKQSGEPQMEKKLTQNSEQSQDMVQEPTKEAKDTNRDAQSYTARSENESKTKHTHGGRGHHDKQHHSSHHKPHTHREVKSDEEKYPHFTWETVGKHDHKDDLWLVIDSGVYNLTKFVDKHPGGSRVIALRAGRKADKTFASGNHPPRVMDKALLQYRIGSIKEDSMIESWQRESKTGRMDSFIALILAALIMGFMGYMIV